jgi:5-methylcytosine-specific restriction endonuclease McrA
MAKKKRDTQPREIITRAEAKARGLPFYFTGKPCRSRGHVGFRYVGGNGDCVQCARERAAAYQAAHPEKVRQWSRKRLAAKLDAERNAKWRREHPKKMRSYQVKWEKKNPEYCRTKCRNRRALIKAAGGTHTPEEIEALAAKQNFKCANPACRKSIRKKRHADHIIPLAKGGSNSIGNIQLYCPPCNHRKAAKHPADWARENGLLL